MTICSRLWIIIVTVTLILSIAQVSYAQKPFEPYMVKDLIPTMGSDAEIREITVVGDIIFFRAFEASTGIELWKSDGAPDGTVLVKDIWPGREGSEPEWLTDINGILFFSANDGVHGREMWKSDGTVDGTVMVLDANPGPPWYYSSSPEEFVSMNGIIYCRGSGEQTGRELMVSDGTAEGTYILDLIPVCDQYGSCWGAHPQNLTPVNGILFFSGSRTDIGHELFLTDGTIQGTIRVKDINPGKPSGEYSEFTVLNGILYFTAKDGVHGIELWRSDGTEAGTYMVKDIYPGGYSSSYKPKNLTVMSNNLFFFAYDGQNHQLWKSDGTETGTVPVKNFYGYLDYLTEINGELWFQADDGIHGAEPWKSDGTEQGTYMVADIDTEATHWDPTKTLGSYPSRFMKVGSETVFPASNEDGTLLWRSDGTAEGTVEIPIPQTLQITIEDLAWTNNKVFFVADDQVHGEELWVADLTADGTVMVKDINPTAGSHAGITEMVDADGTVFFMARVNDPSKCGALYKTDGTEEGTVPVKIDQCLEGDPAFGTDLVSLNGIVYSHGNIWPKGEILFRSNGTTEGTGPFFFFENDARISRELTRAGDYLYFETRHWVENDGYGYTAIESVWRTDGTPEGTIVLASFIDEGMGCYPYTTRLENRNEDFEESNGLVFFNYCDPQYGWELWKTDGTPEGTSMVKDLNPGARDSSVHNPYHGNPRDLIDITGTLYFRAYTENEGAELWMSDGTEAGTDMVKDLWPGTPSSFPDDFANVYGRLYFSAVDDDYFPPPAYKIMLWTTDGTAEGTVSHSAPYVWSWMHESIPHDITAFKGSAFFSTPYGMALWRIDSSGTGVEIVKEFEPYDRYSDSGIGQLMNVNETLFFSGYMEETGGGIWMSDGTEEGSTLLSEPLAGPVGLASAVVSDGTLFYIGNDPLHGSNLWAIRTTVFVDGCNSGVKDQLYEGKYITTWIEGCADSAKNHGQFVSCVSKFTNKLKKAGLISGGDKGAIQSCAAQAELP